MNFEVNWPLCTKEKKKNLSLLKTEEESIKVFPKPLYTHKTQKPPKIYITGTRPALSMSHPVCYSAGSVVNVVVGCHHQQLAASSQLNDSSSFSRSSSSSSSMEQRMLEGRLVIPDASITSSPSLSPSSSSSDIVNNNLAATTAASVQPPSLSPEESFAKLHEALSLEPKFQPSLYLPQESQVREPNYVIFILFISLLRIC